MSGRKVLPMLEPPRKRTKEIEWRKPLREYITNKYRGSASEFSDGLNLLHDVQIRCCNSEATEKSYSDFNLYLGLLRSVGKRFPISEGGVRVRFAWSDSLSVKDFTALLPFMSDKVTSYSITFEQAAVIYNMAVIKAVLGAREPRTSEDSIKRASALFQSSAGMYDKVAQIMEEHPEDCLTVDMQPTNLRMLATLMLAQAQECVYEKATDDGMKSSILTKLAMQISYYYSVVLGGLEALENDGLPFLRLWLAHVFLRKEYFLAAAHFRISIVYKEQIKYGLQVAHLSIANQVLDSPSTWENIEIVSRPFAEQFELIRSFLGKHHAEAKKDNDKIFYCPVPKEVDPLPKHALVKYRAPEDLGKLEKDPFHKLVPYELQQVLLSYTSQRNAEINKLLRSVEEYNDIAKSSLSSMGLPGSILAFENPTSAFPEDIMQKIRIMRKDGGVDRLLADFEEIDSKARAVTSLCKDAAKALDEEEQRDNHARQTYGPNWRRTPSHVLTAQIRNELAKYRGNLDHAAKSDEYVKQKFKANQPLLCQLNGPEEQLAHLVPSGVKDGQAQLCGSSIAQLKHLLGRLDGVVADRVKLHNEVKQREEDDDITDTVSNSDHPEEVVETELLKYEPLRKRLKENMELQDRLMTQISDANTEFTQQRSAQGVENVGERTRVFQQINNALLVYLELKRNLAEGKKFYNDMRNIVLNFKARCDDFAISRRMEADELRGMFSQQAQQQLHPQQTSYSHPPPQNPGWQ